MRLPILICVVLLSSLAAKGRGQIADGDPERKATDDGGDGSANPRPLELTERRAAAGNDSTRINAGDGPNRLDNIFLIGKNKKGNGDGAQNRDGHDAWDEYYYGTTDKKKGGSGNRKKRRGGYKKKGRGSYKKKTGGSSSKGGKGSSSKGSYSSSKSYSGSKKDYYKKDYYKKDYYKKDYHGSKKDYQSSSSKGSGSGSSKSSGSSSSKGYSKSGGSKDSKKDSKSYYYRERGLGKLRGRRVRPEGKDSAGDMLKLFAGVL